MRAIYGLIFPKFHPQGATYMLPFKREMSSQKAAALQARSLVIASQMPVLWEEGTEEKKWLSFWASRGSEGCLEYK